MKLSTRVRYGMRMMLDLALHWDSGAVRLRDIAERQEISKKYLEQIVIPLEAAGLVRSIRGVGGGYVLARAPAEIRLDEIVRILGGPLTLIDCVEDPRCCSRVNSCATRDLWRRMADALSRVLEPESLQDLVNKQLSLGGVHGKNS
ncbi:MAG TPA: Rrf2 family transcriptional regulator [bacterium (Candidatus Stahlbacteria)]|nr:Rrf2 family transcriptional regulator [Candidatus Stahlbacteria bacterium]